MKIDSHQHFWKYDPMEYEWIDESMKRIRLDFLPNDLQKELKYNGFDGAVAVQARQSLEETEWLLNLAEGNDFIKGVVGWVDLCSDDVGRQLRKYTSNPKLVGIRHIVQGEPDDRFMLRKDFMKGVGQLKEFNLTYDILIYPKHLPVANEFIKNFPEQPFVVDHLAKPFIKKSELEPWRSEIKRIAAFPDVCCKISGMVTEADWKNWKEDDFLPYMDTIYQAFGEDRIMFGSDWPVCLVAADYQQVINIVQLYFKNKVSSTGMDKFFGLNCKNFYNL